MDAGDVELQSGRLTFGIADLLRLNDPTFIGEERNKGADVGLVTIYEIPNVLLAETIRECPSLLRAGMHRRLGRQRINVKRALGRGIGRIHETKVETGHEITHEGNAVLAPREFLDRKYHRVTGALVVEHPLCRRGHESWSFLTHDPEEKDGDRTDGHSAERARSEQGEGNREERGGAGRRGEEEAGYQGGDEPTVEEPDRVDRRVEEEDADEGERGRARAQQEPRDADDGQHAHPPTGGSGKAPDRISWLIENPVRVLPGKKPAGTLGNAPELCGDCVNVPEVWRRKLGEVPAADGAVHVESEGEPGDDGEDKRDGGEADEPPRDPEAEEREKKSSKEEAFKPRPAHEDEDYPRGKRGTNGRPRSRREVHREENKEEEETVGKWPNRDGIRERAYDQEEQEECEREPMHAEAAPEEVKHCRRPRRGEHAHRRRGSDGVRAKFPADEDGERVEGETILSLGNPPLTERLRDGQEVEGVAWLHDVPLCRKPRTLSARHRDKRDEDERVRKTPLRCQAGYQRPKPYHDVRYSRNAASMDPLHGARYAATVPGNPPRTNPKAVILMPAYHAGKQVINTFQRIPEEYRKDVIIVDDASTDDTFALASMLPARTYRNENNLGYGGNMKVCFDKGLQTKGDLFVELHADGQYDPGAIPRAMQALAPTDGIVLGSRFLRPSDALKHGMPLVKFVVNPLLTAAANMLLGTRLTEFHSGFHVYTRTFLEQVNYRANSDDHLFSFEILLQAMHAGFTISEIPIACSYGEGVTQMKVNRKSAKYVVGMFGAIGRYHRARAGRPDPSFETSSRATKEAPRVDIAEPVSVQPK